MDSELLSGPLFELKWSGMRLGPETGQGQRGELLGEQEGGRQLRSLFSATVGFHNLRSTKQPVSLSPGHVDY